MPPSILLQHRSVWLHVCTMECTEYTEYMDDGPQPRPQPRPATSNRPISATATRGYSGQHLWVSYAFFHPRFWWAFCGLSTITTMLGHVTGLVAINEMRAGSSLPNKIDQIKRHSKMI